MSTWPKLSHAPVVEGLIDISVERSTVVTLDALKACADVLAADFPSREELRTFIGQFRFAAKAPPQISAQAPSPSPMGLVLRSADARWVAQFRLDGFTLSRLEPYTAWQDLKTRAQELWRKYSEAAQPKRIVRVASRFINRIPLPPGESFEKTFTTTFTVAATLPQSVAAFLLRVVIPFEQEGAMAIVTQALSENNRDCTFDIDAFAMLPEGVSDVEAWSKLDQLRHVKNRLFFESLTVAGLEKFK